MPSIQRIAFVTSYLALFVCSQFASGQLAATQINGSGLKAEIIVHKAKYELVPAISGEDFFLKVSAANRQQSLSGPLNVEQILPDPPNVDLTLRIFNSSNRDLILATGGDQSPTILRLNGPGALNVASNRLSTAEMRGDSSLTIKSKSFHDFPIKSLASGTRNNSDFSYWTRPGEFTLKAIVNCTIDGTRTQLETESVKLTVVDTNIARPKVRTLTAGISIASAMSILDDAGYSVKGGWQMESKDRVSKIACRKISDGIEVAIYYNETSKQVTKIAMLYRLPRSENRENYQVVATNAITFNPDGTYDVKFQKPMPLKIR